MGVHSFNPTYVRFVRQGDHKFEACLCNSVGILKRRRESTKQCWCPMYNVTTTLLTSSSRANKMVQWVKFPWYKPSDLSSDSGTQVKVEGEFSSGGAHL